MSKRVLLKNEAVIDLLRKKQVAKDAKEHKRIRRQLRKRGFYLSRQKDYDAYQRTSLDVVIKSLK